MPETVSSPTSARPAALRVHVQDASGHDAVPSARTLGGWLRRALAEDARGELAIRIVGEEESAALNERYRGRKGPTNVLSFAGPDLPGAPAPAAGLLGDLVICAPVVTREADAQGKAREAHWAHIALHGALHLLGYDHETDADAREMERREIELLAALGFGDPYAAER